MSLDALDFANITELMKITYGIDAIKIGLIDGPVDLEHKDLNSEAVQIIKGDSASCNHSNSSACAHGTFIAGILAGKRNSQFPGICPGCSFLLRPIFSEGLEMPSASAGELAKSILECIDAEARAINLSLALVRQTNDQKK